MQSKATSQPHLVAGTEKSKDHLVVFDYFYFGDYRNDGDGDPKFKFIVVKDKQSRARFAHAVPCKGAEEHTINCIREDLLRLG